MAAVEWTDMREPTLTIRGGKGDDVRVVIMVLPGGRQYGYETVHRLRLTYLRMLPFSRIFRRVAPKQDIAIWRLRYRYRGWNGSSQDPVADVEWALQQVAARHPAARVILLGHSMGGRAALRSAGRHNVTAVCALAPWLPTAEPVSQLRGRSVQIVHGDLDTITDPQLSRKYVRKAMQDNVDIRLEIVSGGGHAMLRRAQTWNQLIHDFVARECRDLVRMVWSRRLLEAMCCDVHRNS